MDTFGRHYSVYLNWLRYHRGLTLVSSVVLMVGCPENSYVEIITLRVMVLGGEAFSG